MICILVEIGGIMGNFIGLMFVFLGLVIVSDSLDKIAKALSLNNTDELDNPCKTDIK